MDVPAPNEMVPVVDQINDKRRTHPGRPAPTKPPGSPADGVAQSTAPPTPPSPFGSILYDREITDAEPEGREVPEFFADLHLDDIVASITAGRDLYDLAPFFYAPLPDAQAVAYRHEVFRDLEDPTLRGVVDAFARGMRAMRERLAHAGKVYYSYEQERWFLDAADLYGSVIAELRDQLQGVELRSRGLLALRDYLVGYAASPAFATLRSETDRVKAELAAVRYRLRIDSGRITVSRYDPEPDYGAEVLETFEKFKQGAGKEYTFESVTWPDMNHVEAAVLDRVARLFPDVFASLDGYCARHREFLDPAIGRFDREIQFYVGYREHVDRLKPAGLQFCYPEVTDRSAETHGRQVFDLALARLVVAEQGTVVTNDFYLKGPERILVISGPNQGGKTTLARTIGQLHHLARIGVPVPAAEARLHLVDRIFAHFEREEAVEDLSGKLEDDLRRVQRILSEATSDSLLIMNESFSSTTLTDQLFINKEVLQVIIDCELLCVAVTFLDELASLDQSTVSMVSTVDLDEPARRTFKIVRRPADGLAYAMAIADKHGLTYGRVKARIRR